MHKIDYSDVNKFLVSTGLVLVGLSILIPYLYLKEDFGLLIEADKFVTLTEQGKQLIANRFFLLGKSQMIIPWIIVIMFLSGISAITIGLIRWFSRQSQIDKKFDLEIVKLEREIESLTPEEKIAKAKKDVDEVELDSAIDTITTTTTPAPEEIITSDNNARILHYMQIEEKLINVFRKYRSPNFDIYDNQRLGSSMEIDLLLKAKAKSFSDRLVEIKYISTRTSMTFLEKCIFRLEKYTNYYRSNVSNKVVPVLIVAYKEISEDMIKDVREKLLQSIQNVPSMKRLKIQFIQEEQIDKFNVREILKK